MPLTRSRAAVLCFGGWGLQTMLHLWPRLRFIQEERWAQGGALAELPDLHRLAAFATIMPWMPGATKEDMEPSFTVWQPKPGHYPPPFFMDRVTEEITRQLNESPSSGAARNTYAERLASDLLRRADEGGYVERLSIRGLQTYAATGQRPTRRSLFAAAIAGAESAARTITQRVIDPTRLDSLQTRDPWVQTSLYVVASLAEPLTSALIWPIMAELATSLGENVVNVIGILSTGSFATDDTRVVEEAATHIALTDLCALLRLNDRHPDEGGLAKLVLQSGKANWERRVGESQKSLFKHIYVLDREKSNQALARDSLELTVLAGNALEVFLVADGGMFLEERLGPDAFGVQDAPFGLLGAACSYVPLSEYVAGAIQEESKRLIRELVLGHRKTDEEVDELPRDLAPEKTASRELTQPPQVDRLLEDLNLTLIAAVQDLVRPRIRTMFERAPDSWSWLSRITSAIGLRRRVPKAIDSDTHKVVEELRSLRFARSYLLPAHVQEALRRERTPWEWRERAQMHFSDAAQHLTEAMETIQLDETWGMNYDTPDVPDNDLDRALNRFHRQTWAMRRQRDTRRLPSALLSVLETIVQDICQLPPNGGLHLAQSRLETWVGQTEDLIDYVSTLDFGQRPEEWRQEYGRRFREWWAAFARASGRLPHGSAVLMRGLLYGGLIIYVGLAWLLNESPLPHTPLVITVGAALSAGVAALLCAAPWLVARNRIRNLQTKRIQLAQEQLTMQVHMLVVDSLRRLYGRVSSDLTRFRDTIHHAIQELEEGSQEENPPRIPPEPLEEIHLRRAHANIATWARIRELVRSEKSTQRENSEQRLWQLWRRYGDMRNWREPVSRVERQMRLAQRVRLALELPFNAVEHEQAVELRARQLLQEDVDAQMPFVDEDARQARLHVHRETVRQQAAAGQWCPFSHSEGDRTGPTECMACSGPIRARTGCPFARREAADQAEGRRMGSSPQGRAIDLLVEAVRMVAEEAVSHLMPNNRVLPNRPDLINRIVQEYSLDRLLASPNKDGNGVGTVIPQSEEARFAFVEDLLARAKPSASYEPIKDDGTRGLEINFAVTAQGERSALSAEFGIRNIPLLASEDQMSIAIVRTVNKLGWTDLGLTERVFTQYRRLNPADKNQLSLPETAAQQQALYGLPTETDVIYEHVLA